MKNNTGLILLFVVLVSLNISSIFSLNKFSEVKDKVDTKIKTQKESEKKVENNVKVQKDKKLEVDPKIKAEKEAAKQKRMSRYFVRGLIKSLNFNDFLAKKCVDQATPQNLSIAVDLAYSISTGKNEIKDLVNLKDSICAEMNKIPEKLKDKATVNKVKDFIEVHMK